MTQRQIDSSKEIRLWIKEIIIPTTIVGVMVFSDPDIVEWCRDKKKRIINKIIRKND